MYTQGLEIGNWRVGELIGEGGMGEVYLAHHRLLATTAALKVLSPFLTADASFRERFFQEAQTQAQLQHSCIAKVLDYVEQDGRFHLVVEYLPGGTLADLIDHAGGPLPIDDTLRWAKQALAALDYAHQRGVIHRDVKPSNIMLDEQRQAKVMDFGIALVMGGRRLTSTGVAMGTPEYMSPEQIIRPKEVDHRTDVYSMGIVIYEMLTGRVPFDGDTDFSIKAAQVNDLPPPLRQVNPAIPEPLERVVMRALTKDPYYRLPGCGQFIRLLDEAMQPLAVGGGRSAAGAAPAFDRDVAPPPVTPFEPRRVTPPAPPPAISAGGRGIAMRWKVISALLLLVAIGAGIAVYIANQRAQEERRRAEEQLQMEKQRAEAAQREREAAEQKAAKEKEEMARALKYANPYTVLQQGVTIKEPDVDESVNSYSKLGSSRYDFWVYALLKNNLYNVDDQTLEYKISVKFPDGDWSHAEKTDYSIESSEEKSVIAVRWHLKDDSLLPNGTYFYLIIIDTKIVASDSFTIP